MKWKRWRSVLVYISSLILGGLLFFKTFQHFDFSRLSKYFEEADLRYFGLLCFSVSLAYVVRSLRWQMLIKASGESVSLFHALIALMTGYFVNQLLPRAGEVMRCVALQDMNKIPMEKTLGTVLVERTIDVLMLFSVSLLSLFIFRASIADFVMKIFQEHVSISATEVANAILFLLAAVIIISLSVFLIYRWRMRFTLKLKRLLEGFRKGIFSIVHLKRKLLFFFYTFLIWFFYFLHTYLLFFIFKPFAGMGMKEGLIIQATGSLAKLVPIQASGVGAYHFLVSGLMDFLKYPAETGEALSIINHGVQLVLVLILGGIGSLIYLKISFGENVKRRFKA